MKAGLGQHTQLKQELKINPRLYQAMDLLYMPMMDLQQHLKQELLGNPFLELVEPEEQAEVSVSDEAKTEKEERQAEDEPEIVAGDGIRRRDGPKAARGGHALDHRTPGSCVSPTNGMPRRSTASRLMRRTAVLAAATSRT